MWRDRYRRLRRRLLAGVGLDVFHHLDLQLPLLALGEGGGRWVCAPEGLSPGSVIWSAGVGRDTSFDRALIAHFGVEVHAFDPTPAALGWLERELPLAGFTLHRVGLADFDGVGVFRGPRKRKFESYSLARTEGVGPSIEAPVQTVGSLMRELGHPRIDLLKLDIEGAEYGVVAKLISQRLPVRQILVEFHHRWREIGLPGGV